MFTQIEAAYNVYITELTAYREWIDATRAKYGGDTEIARNSVMWGDHDYQDVQTKNAELKAVERALGLTPEEIRNAEHGVGIKSPQEIEQELNAKYVPRK